MKLDHLLHSFIPDHVKQDILTYTQARNLISACLISIIAAPLYAAIYFSLNETTAMWGIIVAEIFTLSSFLILKYTGSIILASTVFNLSLLGALVWITYFLGGIYSASVYWLVLLPLIACFLGNIKQGMIWCAITIIFITAFYLLHYFEHVFPHFMVDALLLQYLSICGLALVIIFLIYFYEHIRQEHIEKLNYIAYHDALTNLPNRVLYQRLLENKIEEAKKHQSSFSIFSIDIDNFRKVNEIFNQEIGDLLLTKIVDRLQQYSAEIYFLARTGGDEFKIILGKNLNDDMIKEYANIFLNILKVSYHINHQEINITVSIGIATFPLMNIQDASIDKYSDIALAKAKKKGGNNFQYFAEDFLKEEERRMEIERRLPKALSKKELYLHFQPQFETKHPNKIVGFEALLHWKNATLGDVPSLHFIPIAEKINIISSLDEWVLREACQHYMEWSKLNLVNSSLTLAINVSIIELYQESFIDGIKNILNETGMPPHCLELELTESAIITDPMYIGSIFKKLNELGVKTAIDDFGAGYTSLSYLATLPVTTLKIDKQFLDRQMASSSKLNIIESIIGLAHKMNLKVTVEGIETQEQLIYLQKMTCDFVQGYYLSKPLEAVNMQALLARNKSH